MFQNFLIFIIFHQHRTIKTKINNLTDLKNAVIDCDTSKDMNEYQNLVNDYINHKYNQMMKIIDYSLATKNDNLYKIDSDYKISKLI